MWRIFYPLRYFALVNTEKRHLDFWPTLVFAMFIATPFLLIPGANFFQTGGFLDKLLTLAAALTGFYVAALVAAATFSHPDLDKTITVGSIALVTKGQDGKRVQELLTRREFATTIFGYLAFAALLLSIFSSIAIALSTISIELLTELRYIGVLFEPPTWIYVRGILIFGFCVCISHISIVTSLGLYYLMDRLYRRDPKVLTRKSDRAA